MIGRRRERIVDELLGGSAAGLETNRLCEVCAEVTGVTGAGIMLMSGAVPRGSVCTTDALSALVEHLQFELEEGPCVDAFNLGQPVLEPDLAAPVTPRWLAFTPVAVDSGIRAIFGFPLRLGAVRLGALNLYRDQPGPLRDEQHADALAMADISAEAILLMQANAPPGQLARQLEEGGDFQYVVHQATGMVAVQLATSVREALVRLRAHAFDNDQALTEVAAAVVARRLRFEP